jgi:energy-coupling factor transporter ATP-binding protein EcfA2
VNLTADQMRAKDEIVAEAKRGNTHLLTGYAGTGKTTLVQEVVRDLSTQRRSVVLTAPTHKAVRVLAQKAEAIGLEVPAKTIQSLLSLRPKPQGDRQIFVRERHAKPIDAEIVVVDECSMIDADLMTHIRRHLSQAFVLFVGDPAQIPPVGETESESFSTKSRSHLETIVRQAEGNPILEAAKTLRDSQGKPLDMSWAKPANKAPHGVFLPRYADNWMEKAFTSQEFDCDPDTFRYLAWTNKRVAEVNKKVRTWKYGEDASKRPFLVGERALARSPVIKDEQILVNTNEEVEIIEIRPDIFAYTAPDEFGNEAWSKAIKSWRLIIKRDSGDVSVVYLPADGEAHKYVTDRLADEASSSSIRWKHLHDFRALMANFQAIYAMTVHTSQGSTFRNAFIDVADIRRRVSTNLLEAQQLFYVAATRPTHGLFLVNA